MTSTAENTRRDAQGGNWRPDDGCGFHWQLSLMNGPVILLDLKSSCDQAYLSADEADAIAATLKDYADEARKGGSLGNPVRSFTIEQHEAPKPA